MGDALCTFSGTEGPPPPKAILQFARHFCFLLSFFHFSLFSESQFVENLSWFLEQYGKQFHFNAVQLFQLMYIHSPNQKTTVRAYIFHAR